MESSFVMIKPDAVQRGFIGQIVMRLENKGLILRAMKFLIIDRPTAENLYDIHRGKPFYDHLVSYILSGPVVVMVWDGPNAISVIRTLVGATKANEALPGTIRGDFGLTVDNNILQACDSVDRSKYELGLFFNDLIQWKKITESWI